MTSSSGVVQQYPFTNRKIIEHAFRRCGVTPQAIGAEHIETATDLLYLIQAEWANAGFMLWTRQYSPLSITAGSPNVATPAGTLEVLHTYWRIINPYRGTATLTGGTSNSSLFSGAASSDVTVPTPDPAVTVNFSSATEVDGIGVLLGGSASVTTALKVYTSSDGVTYTLAQTLPSTTFAPMVWQYFDLDPFITAQYVRLQYTGAAASWVLNQVQFCLANGQDIESGPLNIDDYYNLPNKQYSSDRPTSAYVDRQVAAPVIKLWPCPSTSAFYNGTATALTRRSVQDPGLLTNIIEAPPRWYEAAIARLASRLIEELPDSVMGGGGGNQAAAMLSMQARQSKFDRLEQRAVKAEALAWSEERQRAPIRLLPSIAAYTR